MPSLVGSEMCIRDRRRTLRIKRGLRPDPRTAADLLQLGPLVGRPTARPDAVGSGQRGDGRKCGKSAGTGREIRVIGGQDGPVGAPGVPLRVVLPRAEVGHVLAQGQDVLHLLWRRCRSWIDLGVVGLRRRDGSEL